MWLFWLGNNNKQRLTPLAWRQAPVRRMGVSTERQIMCIIVIFTGECV